MKVAIVHYWLVSMRGGEKVVEALCEMFPDADVYTHVYRPDRISPTIRAHDVRTTFIQGLPGSIKHYQKYLPLMPMALEQLDLRGYDLVISSESGPAKGVVVPPTAAHICYCHTPMRYVWDMYHDYVSDLGRIRRTLTKPILHYLRLWDVATAARVDHFVANSTHVAQRIRKYYRRSATVIHPPVDVDHFRTAAPPGEAYAVMGQLVRYKRVDLAVAAFNRMRRKLVVIGEGDQWDALRREAGPTVQMLGWQPADAVREQLAECRGLIFPGQEDFGIVPVEAMAAGRPVVAYARGGAAETVVHGETGVLFEPQSVDALVDAVERLERGTIGLAPPARIAAHAKQFGKHVFKARMQQVIDRAMAK